MRDFECQEEYDAYCADAAEAEMQAHVDEEESRVEQTSTTTTTVDGNIYVDDLDKKLTQLRQESK